MVCGLRWRMMEVPLWSFLIFDRPLRSELIMNLRFSGWSGDGEPSIANQRNPRSASFSHRKARHGIPRRASKPAPTLGAHFRIGLPRFLSSKRVCISANADFRPYPRARSPTLLFVIQQDRDDLRP